MRAPQQLARRGTVTPSGIADTFTLALWPHSQVAKIERSPSLRMLAHACTSGGAGERDDAIGASHARRCWHGLCAERHGRDANTHGRAKKKRLASILSVSERTVQEWLRIFELWLACHTQEEIAEIVQRERVSATRALKNVQNSNLAELNKIRPRRRRARDGLRALYERAIAWQEETERQLVAWGLSPDAATAARYGLHRLDPGSARPQTRAEG